MRQERDDGLTMNERVNEPITYTIDRDNANMKFINIYVYTCKYINNMHQES